MYRPDRNHPFLTPLPSDPSGALRFGGKAVIHASGVDFSNGSSFSINMSEFELSEELGRGNYGTVKKVFHKPTKVVMAMKVSPSKISIDPHIDHPSASLGNTIGA